MIHIRSFNETLVDRYEEIVDYSEVNLSYLLDDDSFELYSYKFGNNIILTIRKLDSNIRDMFKWDDVKDHIIPYVTQLDKKFSIKNIGLDYIDNDQEYHINFDTDNIIKDEIEQYLKDEYDDSNGVVDILEITITLYNI